VYFAHPTITYQSLIERRGLYLIKEFFGSVEVVNPSDYSTVSHGDMDFFYNLIDQVDAVIFTLLAGFITFGVANEVKHALKHGRDVYYLDWRLGKFKKVDDLSGFDELNFKDTNLLYNFLASSKVDEAEFTYKIDEKLGSGASSRVDALHEIINEYSNDISRYIGIEYDRKVLHQPNINFRVLPDELWRYYISATLTEDGYAILNFDHRNDRLKFYYGWARSVDITDHVPRDIISVLDKGKTYNLRDIWEINNKMFPDFIYRHPPLLLTSEFKELILRHIKESKYYAEPSSWPNPITPPSIEPEIKEITEQTIREKIEELKEMIRVYIEDSGIIPEYMNINVEVTFDTESIDDISIQELSKICYIDDIIGADIAGMIRVLLTIGGREDEYIR